MKKKLLLIAMMVVIFALALVVSVSAENKIIKLGELPTLDEIRANPESYVSHLDAFDSSNLYLQDPTSVVVLCDQQAVPSYFVFPASYIINSTSYNLSYDALNKALANADASVFAGYARNSGRGGTIYMIRIEVPTYVNRFGYDKFESNVNVKEVYFPTHIVVNEETGEEREVTYFSEFTQADFFNGASSLEVIHNIDKVPTTYFTNAFFAYCSSLKSIKLPQGLTGIGGSCFVGCSSLESIEIPETVTSISGSAFKACSSLKEITLPNSDKSIGKGAFSNCSSLETVRFGAGFNTFSRVNQDYETFYNCDSLKYVYIPSGFLTAVSGATKGDYKHIFNDIDSEVTFFFTGTKAEAEEIVRLMALTNNNPTLGNAVIEAYDPTKDYSGAETNIIVYGYNLCDAFYKSEHNVQDINACVDKCVQCLDVVVKANPQHAITTTYAYENGFSASGTKTVCCGNKDCPLNKEAEVSSIDAIFEGFVYSTREENGSRYGIVLSYYVNTDALSAYQDNTDKTVSYGVMAIAKQGVNGNPLNADGTPSVESIIATDVTGIPSVDFIIWGSKNAWETELEDGTLVADIDFYILGYVAENGALDYFCAEASSKDITALTALSYNDIKAM